MSPTRARYPATAWRRRMSADLQLRGLSERPHAMYVRAVRQRAEPDGKPQDQITDEERREYVLPSTNVKKWSRAGMTIALCGIKFFSEPTLQRPWTSRQGIRPPKDKRLPTVLSLDDVQRIVHHVRLQRSRLCWHTRPSGRLHAGEALHRHVRDADSVRLLRHLGQPQGARIVMGHGRTAPWHGDANPGKCLVAPDGLFRRHDAAAHAIARHQPLHDRRFYRTAAAALQKLADERHCVGGQLGVLGVRHIWTRDRRDHPPRHEIVAGGGLSADGLPWRAARDALLGHPPALSTILRAKFRDAVKAPPE